MPRDQHPDRPSAPGRQRGAPEQVQVRGLGDYLEVMSKAVFQAGMSWAVVERKWQGTSDAFHGFDPEAVAALPPWEVDRLAQDPRIIRNRRKIEAVIANAQRLIELDVERGSFRNYLRSHAGYDALERDLRKQFRFLGEMGIYTFLYIVGEEVPDYEEWSLARGRTPMNGG